MLRTLFRSRGVKITLTVKQIRLLADLQNAHDETSRGISEDDWFKKIVAALDGVATKFHLRFDPKGASA